MKITMRLKEGVSFDDAINIFNEIIIKDQRIQNDVHTNKHYVLFKGKICMKGNGVGKYWDLLGNSREAHKQAYEMMGYS